MYVYDYLYNSFYRKVNYGSVNYRDKNIYI